MSLFSASITRIGPPKKRFRSINEFIPHAIWLMSPNHDTEICFCKYCKGPKAQREITASISHIIGGSPGPSPSIPRIKPLKKDKGKGKDPAEGAGLSARVPRPTRPRADPNLFGAVQKRAKLLRAGPDVLSHPVVDEAHRDVRAVHAKTSMQIRRYFREGEVIWCRIYPSIVTPDPEVENIEWWPGVIDEYTLKSVPVPRATSEYAASCDPPPAGSSSQPIQVNENDEGRGVILQNTNTQAPWDVKQSFTYRIQLMGTKHVINDVSSADVIPYVAFCPSDELLNEMKKIPDEKMDFDKDLMHKFNPSPGGDGPRDFEEAVPAFALAMQIASGLASFWCVTDEFTMHFGKISHAQQDDQVEETGSISAKPRMLSRAPSQSISAPPSQSKPKPPSDYMSLSSAIQAASEHNDKVMKASQYKSTSTINVSHSKQDNQRITRRVVGIQQHASQTRYQGLWWGCERIWLGDFLRLKMPRRGLAPNGAQRILAPGGPSKSTIESQGSSSVDGQPIGAGNRSVFVRLDGLYAVKVPGEDGKMRNEARFCGPLFELVEQDWEGPDPWKHVEGKKQANGADPAAPSAPPKQHTSLTTLPASQFSMPPQKDIMPEAPVGFKFRPIVEPGWEFVGSMAMIGGRYYPRILHHPRLAAETMRLMSLPEHIGLTKGSNLWSLEGLLAGYYNSVDPHKYKKSRLLMMQGAEATARLKLEDFLADIRRVDNMDVEPMNLQPNIPADDAMVVDQPETA